MPVSPQQLPLHLTKIDTAKGRWLIAVDSILETQEGHHFLMNLTLEQNVDDEQVISRKLGMNAPAALMLDPESSEEVVDRICKWIEASEGDGFLDLAA